MPRSIALEESERLQRHIERVLDSSGQGTAETKSVGTLLRLKERGQVSMTNNGTKYPGHQHQRQLCLAD